MFKKLPYEIKDYIGYAIQKNLDNEIRLIRSCEGCVDLFGIIIAGWIIHDHQQNGVIPRKFFICQMIYTRMIGSYNKSFGKRGV